MAAFEWPEKIEFVNSDEPGLERRRCGRGFVYLTPKGRRVTDRATIARISAIAIPPAWNGVWIASSAHAHLQATGRDARRRKQYRYHPVWADKRRRANYDRLVDFGRALPSIREYIDAGLRRPCLDKDRVLALALRILDTGMIRIGNDEYLKHNGSRGLTTLHKRNVEIEGSDIELHFSGKGGVDYELSIHDARAARALRRCHELPGQRLFRYVADGEELRPIGSSDINERLEQLTGQKFTAKDLRTWAGTVIAFSELRNQDPGSTAAETARIVNGVCTLTAGVLGNTLAVCRRYYIHPRVIEGFAAGKLATMKHARAKGRMTSVEVALLRFLERAK